MEKRVTDEQIAAFVAYRNATMGGDRPFSFLERELFLDLRDARAELARMKALSDSQAEALDMIDQGVKL